MSVGVYSMLVAAATVAIAALMGWGTYAAGGQRVSTDESRLVKRRLFVSAASLELVMVLSALAVLIAGVQVAYGDPSHVGGTVVWLLFLNLLRLLAFAGCVCCVLTYPAFRKFVVESGRAVLAIGICVSLLLMLFLGTWMLMLTILLTFFIRFISFMYLRKLKVAAPTPAYALETPASDDGKTWTLRPVPGVGLPIDSSLTTAPTVVKPGDEIALLPRGKSAPSDAFATVIVKTSTRVLPDRCACLVHGLQVNTKTAQ